MSVDYTPILAIGLEFECESDIEDFLLKHGIISGEDEITDDGITEFMYNHDSGLDVECLDYYNGDRYFVGKKLYPRDVNKFEDQVATAINSLEELFPEVKFDMIHTVKVH